MDYKNTLNLPQTDFSMRANLTSKEPEFLKFWEGEKIYHNLRKIREGSPKYILHDGPPYANGNIHMGHALNKILKDIIVKYKSMMGYDSPFIPGWDCHGLPIELRVLEETKNIKDLSKSEIRRRCREYALHYCEVQKQEFKRLGIFGDWENPYLTLSPAYVSNTVKMFGKLVKEGYVYKSLKPVYWCYSCQTALAEAEVEYYEKETPSIYVEFKVKKAQNKLFQDSSVLIWTTTPWTLPANVAIALHPDFNYLLIEVNGKKIMLVEDLVEVTLKKIGVKNYNVLKSFKGQELEGIVCKHPFIERDSLLILGNYVTRDQGTGCVHIAPGHGLEDFESGQKYGLPIISPVNNEGIFTKEAGEFVGKEVFQANPSIINRLKELGSLLHSEKITHSYPHCWRCKKPVIFRATEQWFINLDVNKLRKNALKSIESVKWIPKWGKERIFHMVESRSDWCISRQRAWGVGIPAFYCKKCNEILLNPEVIDYISDLIRENGEEVWTEREAKDLLPKDTYCKKCNSNEFEKETDILDVWFESGISYAAVLKEKEDLTFPANLYLEGSDQHRGWFQSSLLTAIGVEKKPPYLAVLTHGFMLDEEGKAMHKTAGNVISPFEIINKFGADILRLWVISEDYRDDVKLGNEILKKIVDSYRKIRNTFRFMLGNLYDFTYEDMVNYEELPEIDKYILHRLQIFIDKTIKAYDEFEFHKIYHNLVNFCTVELSAFYLDILKDRLYTWKKTSIGRRAAQTVLVELVKVLTSIIAPVLSFTSEEIWQHIKEKIPQAQKSIHLERLPQVNDRYLNPKLQEIWTKLLKLRDEVSIKLEDARTKGLIGSSLEAKVILTIPETEQFKIIRDYKDELNYLFIVSQVEINSTSSKNIQISVERADGQKCQRCWNYSTTVGKDTKYSTLCTRCIEAIN